MPVLARAWQMLLKGHDEVRNSPRPLAAADMVLVRLAYVADLPTPGDMARYAKAGGNAEAARSRSEAAPAADAPASARVDTPPPVMEETENPAPQGYRDELEADPAPDRPMPQSFEDVVALVEEKRDLKLKNALLEQVRLVHFKPGAITLNPLPTAASDLLQELTRKLQTWTGHRWLVVRVEGKEGAEPLGAQRRAEAAREVEALEGHPAVQEVFRRFPGAKIREVRAIVPEAPDADDVSGDFGEPDVVTNDGTN